MRVTNVSLFSNDVEAVNFALTHQAPKSQYIARTMIGLDADEIVPKFYGFGLHSSPKYYNFGLKPREIVMRLVLNPRMILDESYSNIRDNLYRAISSSRTGAVELRFFSGATTVASIFGFIVKFEVPHFSKTPEVQITVRCEDPMFRAVNPVVLKEDEIPAISPIIVWDSISTAPHGFDFDILWTATSPIFTIQDVITNEEWKFEVIPNGGFLVGDILHFCSEYNAKELYIKRGANTIHIIDKITPGSFWPVIFPGGNEFFIQEDYAFTWQEISFHAAYWGV